jgi:hypothetical protein
MVGRLLTPKASWLVRTHPLSHAPRAGFDRTKGTVGERSSNGPSRWGFPAFSSPQASEGWVHCTREIRHPPQCLIAFGCSYGGQQSPIYGLVCDVAQHSWHFRDRAVGRCHKRGNPSKRIDDEITRICLLAPLDANGLVGEATLLEGDVRRHKADPESRPHGFSPRKPRMMRSSWTGL